jgi:ectoine hydroxylase-related dioxygenase (phytanoyl-CoA dioxygenase family)
MPHTVFKDKRLEKEFNEKGYVKVPFLSSDEITYLKTRFFETIEESGGPKTAANVDYESSQDISYDFTFIDKNTDYKQKVFDIITRVFQAKADAYLNDYTPIIANYIRKKEGGGEVPMHQNWAFVDEEKYTSVSIWVPLVDSNEENGTLQMVDGSHKRFGKHRGPMVPWELRNITKEIIANNLTPMNVKAGEGVILDDSIVHYSNINKTPGLRLAIQLIMIPKESTSLHYHLDRDKDPNTISVFETNVDFYTHFHPWLKPTGIKEIGTVPFQEKNYSYTDFLRGLKTERFDVPSTNKKISPLFLNPDTQTQFDENGFVKIPLLTAAEVEDLKTYYLSLKHDHIGEYGFHVSLDNSNDSYINGVFDKLFGVLVPKLNPLLNDYKPFTASYVIKEAGLQNIVPPHQDWTFVDETEFCSATVWIPLMDVNKNNGALSLIKGSHKLFNEPRCSPSPQAKSALSNYLFDIFPFVEVIDMKAGEALIFNNRTVHASPPNISGTTRMGVGIGITQKNAGLVHHYLVPHKENMVNVYKVNETFFRRYNNKKLSGLFDQGELPDGLELAYSYKKNHLTYTKEEITNLITSTPGVSFNEALMRELAELYNYSINGVPKETSSEEQITPIEKETPAEKQKTTVTDEWIDPRSFFEKYTPANIFAELKYRLTKK